MIERFDEVLLQSYETELETKIECSSSEFKVGKVSYEVRCQMKLEKSNQYKQYGQRDINGTIEIEDKEKPIDPEQLFFPSFDIVLPDRIIKDIMILDWKSEWYGYTCTFTAMKIMERSK